VDGLALSCPCVVADRFEVVPRLGDRGEDSRAPCRNVIAAMVAAPAVEALAREPVHRRDIIGGLEVEAGRAAIEEPCTNRIVPR